MKVVLISPPWLFKGEVEFVSQNLGLGYLASYLQKYGHEVVIIDALLSGINTSSPLRTKYAEVLRWGLSDEEVLNRIPKDVDCIGITAPFTDSRFIVNPLSRKIKSAFPETVLVMGGVYPSTLPEEALRLSGVDVVVIGEGEIPFLQIVEGRKWEEITGLSFRKDGMVIGTGKGEIIRDLDHELPAPSYDLRSMKKYVEWSPRGNKIDKTLSIVSSRGCPFSCSFCSVWPVYGRCWRAFSAKRIICEIQEAIDRLGITHVEFEDDNLTLKKERAIEIFDRINVLRGGDGKKLRWSTPNGVMIDSLDRELVFKMKESGLELINLPVESGDEKILKLMNKHKWETHLQKTLEVAGYCKSAGIERVCAFIIVGYPGEDRKSFERTMAYCEKLLAAGVTDITPLVATPYPSTRLYEFCAKEDWLIHPDMENMLIYQRYSEFLPEFCHISTPWCSAQEAFNRHREMMRRFPTLHNVRKD